MANNRIVEMKYMHNKSLNKCIIKDKLFNDKPKVFI